ncbi:MAG: hypothetical protein FJ088_00225 [Deltaproteobacteria bacterium]|nr:hypothetical protein [Deltaproteobacteria bacterium]
MLELQEGALSVFKSPFTVNYAKAGEQKFLSASGGKSFLIAWYEEGAGIRTVTMDKNGMLGSEVQVGDMFYPHVTGSDAFAVTSGGAGLKYAKFDQDGKKTYGPVALFSDKIILLSSSAFTSQTVLTSAFSMMKTMSESAVYLTEVSYPYEFFPVDDSQYSQTSPDIAASSDGHFLIVWESDGEDGSSYGIFGKMF